MNPAIIPKAFILAAGLGTRLRPYTDAAPKPMVKVWGRSLIDHALDRLQEAKTGQVWVNLHHFGQQLETHLRNRSYPKITLSWEENLLDTGGGIRRCLDGLGPDAFYVVNGDALWTNGDHDPALTRLARVWDPERMDILLMLHPLEKMTLTRATGDYDLSPDQSSVRRNLQKSGAYAFTGVRIAHPRIFDDTPSGPFPFLDLMDRAERAGRLFGVVHDADWHHISTPEDLERVQASGPPAGQEPRS